MNRFDLPTVQAVLTTRVFGRNLVILPRTNSTNDVAKGLAMQGAPEGTVVLIEEQTAGRGRMGRRWLAPPGVCLLCSILFRSTLPPAQAQRLTMLCALATADAVKEIAALQAWLKWPNDIVIKSQIPNSKSPTSNLPSQDWRKLAGVLTETRVTEEQVQSQTLNPKPQDWRLEYVIVGIGLNVNVAPRDLPGLAPDATSILAETGQEVDRTTLLAVLLAGVEDRYARLRDGESPHAEWTAGLATLGRSVEVATPGGTLTGVAEAVDKDGALLLRTPDRVLHRLLAGDVTLARQ